ncbi:YqiJ family protein [Kiloniella litopenaei]|uniref:YqiJ family protein n=1 Tax=Kiloniella litopenaei TaxID=1549748 RepID=UPI003BAD2C99
MEFITADENLPFVVSLIILLIIGALEGAALLIGLGFSAVLDSMVPDLDVDIDGPDLGANNTLGSLLTWLRVGKVPLLILLILFFLFFGLSGLAIQGGVDGVMGLLLPGYLASIPAFILALYLVRLVGAVFEKLMPSDETSAVSSDSFVGRVATIVLGVSETGKPAQAKVKDRHGLEHYLLVEPDNTNDIFETGSSVLLVRKVEGKFFGIAASSELLSK